MPCRSDYMEPSAKEKKAWTVWREDAQKLADALTYSADMLREHVLEGNSDSLNREMIGHVAQAERYRLEVEALTKRFDRLYLVPSEYGGYKDRLVTLLSDYTVLDRIVVEGEQVSADTHIQIEKDQIKHREADLRRLMKTFAESGDRERLKKVLDADNTKPLEPQLGFSPDAF